MDGQWGAGGGPGTVYRLSAFNGYVPEVFANITLDGRPNSGAALGNIAYDKWNRQFYVSDLETGMVHRLRLSDGFDAGQYDHGADGRANFIDAASGLPDSLPPVAFDPTTSARITDCPSGDFSRDPSCWNVADFRRRVWGLGVQQDELTGEVRLFYAVWSSQGLGNPDHLTAPEEWPNTIWSVGIGADGAFDTTDVRREAVLPDFFRDPAAIARAGYSHPVTDIAFPSQGTQDVMLVAERGGLRNRGLMAEDAFAIPRESRVLRFERDVDGVWQPIGRYDVGYQDRELEGPPYLRAGSAGGVAFALGYDATGALDLEAADAFVWITGDGLCGPEGPCRDAAGDLTDITEVHGVQGNTAARLVDVEPAEALQPYPFPGPATPTTSLDASHLADADLGLDGTGNDATRIGDIAVYQDAPAFAWTPEDYPWWPVPDPDPGVPDLELVKTGPTYCDWASDCSFLIRITNVGDGTYEGGLTVADYIFPGNFVHASPGWTCDIPFGGFQPICRHDPVVLASGDTMPLILTFTMPMAAGPIPEWDTEGRNCAAIIWPGSFDTPEQEILMIEMALQIEGYPPGTIDGVMDADLQTAIDDYRFDIGLPPGGIDADLYAALYPGDGGAVGDANPANDEDCHDFLLPGQDRPDLQRDRLDLALSKELISAECVAGELCDFRITISNTGTRPYTGPLAFRDAAGMVGGDPVPLASYVWPALGLDCFAAGTPVLCQNIGLTDLDIPAGASIGVVMRIRYPLSFAGERVGNCAILDRALMNLADDLDGGNEFDCDYLDLPREDVPQMIDLAMEKRLVSEGCAPGAECRFFIGVTNMEDTPFLGPIAYGDYLDMDGAAGLPLETLSSEFNTEGCTAFEGGSMRCAWENDGDGLEPGNDLRDRMIVQWPDGLPVLRNCATIRWSDMGLPEGDSDPSNDEVCVDVSAPDIPDAEIVPVLIDLSVTKSAPDTCEQGAACPFEMTIANNGAGDFIGPIFLADELSEGPMGALVGASDGLSCYVISDANGFCRQEPLVLDEGDAITVTAVWTIPGDYPPGMVENCASLALPRGPGGEPNLLMVQSALLQQGYEVVLSNTMDPQTQGAIIAYRAAEGLPPGDAVDDDLLDALFGDAGAWSEDRIAGNDTGCDTLEVVERPMARADLAVGSQTECVRGESCLVTAWIENVGEGSFEGIAGMRGELDPALTITSLKSQSAGFICATTGEATYECLGARLSLAPGDQARVELLLDVPADFGPDVVMHIKEMIWPDASVRDANAPNDTDSQPIDIVDPPEPEAPPMPDIAVSKVANQGSCQAGALCRFSVNVSNNGPGTYTGDIRITDTLSPSSASLQSYSPSGWSCSGSGGQISCTLPDATLPPGASQSLSLTVRPSSRLRGTMTNCAGLNWVGDVPVRDIQAALNDRGFNAGPADGIPGRRTQAAIIAYQNANGLEPTAAIDAALLRSLLGLQSTGDPVAANDQDCARVNIVAPPTVTPDPEPDPVQPVCPGGWQQVTLARANALGAQGWKIQRVRRSGITIICATPDEPALVLQCPRGFDQVTRSNANALRARGYTIQQVTGGGQSIWCAKAPAAPSCPSGYRQVSRNEAKSLAGTHDIRQVGNLLCAKRRAVVVPDIELAPGLTIRPEALIPQLR